MSKVQDPLIHALELEAQVSDEEVNLLPRCHHNSTRQWRKEWPHLRGTFQDGKPECFCNVCALPVKGTTGYHYFILGRWEVRPGGRAHRLSVAADTKAMHFSYFQAICLISRETLFVAKSSQPNILKFKMGDKNPFLN